MFVQNESIAIFVSFVVEKYAPHIISLLKFSSDVCVHYSINPFPLSKFLLSPLLGEEFH